nr:MAG TPA: hypothetical protein [Caudoviricetes sp.]
MGTISRESAKRRNKETSRQKRRRSKISDITRRKNAAGKDELNVMK